jgi:hypothetical protein
MSDLQSANGLGVAATRKYRQSSHPPRPSLNMSFARVSGRDELELLQDFEFDSDIDMPPEDPQHGKQQHTGDPGPDQNEGIEDPWNAVCVVGLKVFSKDPQLRLQVVRPESGDGEAPLDRDDPAVSATLEKKSSWLSGDWQR